MTRFLTPAQVMERLQLGRATVYRLLEAGTLPAVKPAGRWRISEADLNTYLESTRPDLRTNAYTPASLRVPRRKQCRADDLIAKARATQAAMNES